MEQHLRTTHGDEYNFKQYGCDQYLDTVYLQSWVQDSVQNAWIVAIDPVPTEDGPLSTSSEPLTSATFARSVCDSEHTYIRHQQKHLASPAEVYHPASVTETTPWIGRTRWADTYLGLHKPALVKLMMLPTFVSRRVGLRVVLPGHQEMVVDAAHEIHLETIMTAVDRLFDRCEETHRRTGHEMLIWLYSQQTQRASAVLFRLAGQSSTRSRYRRLWKSFLVFLLRLYIIPRQLRHYLLGVHFTPEQEK